MHLLDPLGEERLAADMTLQDLLIFAAQKEKQAVELYDSMARTAEADGLREIFLFLAGQEREHKLKLEAEYEKQVLQEN